jgi:hypothetical protein
MKLDVLMTKLAEKKEKETEIKAKYEKLDKEKKLTTEQRIDRIEEMLGLK